jgi:hypothetical protein
MARTERSEDASLLEINSSMNDLGKVHGMHRNIRPAGLGTKLTGHRLAR